ncbi:MAG: hypothetical protein RI894_2176 [Bacteroidota bacterium]
MLPYLCIVNQPSIYFIMNKIAKLFVLAGVTFVLACGPKGPSDQEKETMRLDSIAKADSMSKVAAPAVTDTAKAPATPAAGDTKAPAADTKAAAPADAKKK